MTSHGRLLAFNSGMTAPSVSYKNLSCNNCNTGAPLPRAYVATIFEAPVQSQQVDNIIILCQMSYYVSQPDNIYHLLPNFLLVQLYRYIYVSQLQLDNDASSTCSFCWLATFSVIASRLSAFVTKTGITVFAFWRCHQVTPWKTGSPYCRPVALVISGGIS